MALTNLTLTGARFGGATVSRFKVTSGAGAFDAGAFSDAFDLGSSTVDTSIPIDGSRLADAVSKGAALANEALK